MSGHVARRVARIVFAVHPRDDRRRLLNIVLVWYFSASMSEPGRTSDSALLLVLRASAVLCFAGWTWGHLYWEGPYGILLWQDSTYELAERWGISWDEFVGSGSGDGWVQTAISGIGWVYAGLTVLAVTVGRRSYLQMCALVLGSGLLTVLSYAKYVATERQLPMLIEHGGQILSPVLLVAALSLGVRHRLTEAIARTAVVATFAGHGAYATGWWPTPGNYHAMVLLILGLDYDPASVLLRWAGLLDFAVCALLFVPPLQRIAAGYAAGWGFVTALARPVAGMSWDLNYWGADQFVHEALLRAPHFLIPLYLFLLLRRSHSHSDRSEEPR